MTERSNPLMSGTTRPGCLQKGTPESEAQLQDHCNRLNQMAGDRHWFVNSVGGIKRVDCSQRTSFAAGGYASRDEVSDIMRKYGFR